MTKLAASSGIVIYEAKNKLYISKSSGTGTSTFLFVTGLITVILLGNGVLQLTVLKDQQPDASKLGIIFILLSGVFAFIFWKVFMRQKKSNAVPLQQLKNICIFDFESNSLLNDQQNLLSPIHEAWLTRKMQLTSSSPELLLCWNGGSLSIVKGNPFSGGIAELEKVLLAKGIKRK